MIYSINFNAYMPISKGFEATIYNLLRQHIYKQIEKNLSLC